MASARERTVVFFHAHPDDEAIFTGGTMALLAAAGWRVVLVLATAGEQGLNGGWVRPPPPPSASGPNAWSSSAITIRA
jgi:LmbE family N-acetylglucosaminyl deacetylase